MKTLKKVIKIVIAAFALLVMLDLGWGLVQYAIYRAKGSAAELKISEADLRHPDVSSISGRSLTMDDMGLFNEYSLKLADKIAEFAEAVANGEITDTVCEVNTEEIFGKRIIPPSECGGRLLVRLNKQGAFTKLLDFRLTKIAHVLTYEHPFDYYWFNKPEGYEFLDLDIGISKDGGLVLPETMRIAMPVVPDYQLDGNVYRVDPEKVVYAKACRDRAQAVVDEAGEKSDIDKILCYCDYICSQNVYNRDAKALNGEIYGDPWQLLYVFDDDPDTNVLCDGYAKAFQFLCDLTDFDSDIHCYTVTGQKNGGEHAWNILHMDDGKCYMADLTTCDNNPLPGGRRARFLEGADSGDWINGFRFDAETIQDGDKTINLPAATYTYRLIQQQLWEDTILDISMEDYR